MRHRPVIVMKTAQLPDVKDVENTHKKGSLNESLRNRQGVLRYHFATPCLAIAYVSVIKNIALTQDLSRQGVAATAMGFS